MVQSRQRKSAPSLSTRDQSICIKIPGVVGSSNCPRLKCGRTFRKRANGSLAAIRNSVIAATTGAVQSCDDESHRENRPRHRRHERDRCEFRARASPGRRRRRASRAPVASRSRGHTDGDTRDDNRRCEVILADCGKPAEAVRCVRETESRLGSVDVLVHSSGGPVNGGLLEITPEAWMEAFDVHVHAIFHLCRATVPAMRAKKEGAIILISSVAGKRGVLSHVGYQVVKGTLPQFARALAREFANDNIRVNCVAPGVIRTPFHAKMTEEQRRLNLDHRIPLHREGTPEQVADLILALVTNEYITGETMTIDGGLTMRIA